MLRIEPEEPLERDEPAGFATQASSQLSPVRGTAPPRIHRSAADARAQGRR
jgi:hypothetical protein